VQQFRVAQTFGGITLFVKAKDPDVRNSEINVEMSIADAALSEVVKRGLERLSGQGRVDEELRSMCHCVGNP
jgi:hypothetical protein